MKHLLFLFFCVGALVHTGSAQTVSITIDAGLLENALGTSVVPDGMLLQLVASSTGTFYAPSSSSYVTGGNALVASFAMDSAATAVSGETENTLSSLPLATSTYTLTVGEDLLLRFYPSVTYSSGTNYNLSAPPVATTYGQVRSNTLEGGDPSETAWVVPAPGGAGVDLDYNTVSDGGPYANSTAYASGVVVVPEPSTYAMLACGLAGVLGLSARKRRGSVA